MNIIYGIPPYLGKDCFVSLDTEFFQMNKKQLHRPNSGKFACMTICPNDEDVYILTDTEHIQPALDNMQDCVWTTQNGKFDFTQLRRYVPIQPRKKWWDTLYIARIMWGGYYDLFGLEDLARRELNIELDKIGQKYFEKATELNDEAIYYSCMDALVTRKIALEQKKQIDKNSFDVWKNVDAPFTWAVMDFRGFPINPDKIKALAENNAKRAEEIGTMLPFNFKSPKQIMTWAKDNNIKISATDEDTLSTYIEKNPDGKGAETFKKILEARGYAHMASTYGFNILEDFLEYEDGYPVVHPEINISGAETGRTCVSGDTILETNLGNFEIQNLELTKDRTYHIITHTGKEQKIIRKIYKGKELMYELQTESGWSIKCTRDHKILTIRGWKSIGELEVGDLAITQNIKNRPSIKEITFSSIRRGKFCGISNTKEDRKNKNSKTIPWNNSTDSRHIERDIQNKIRRCFEESEKLSILYGFKRKYSWKEKSSINSNTKRSTLTLNKFRKEVICYSQRTPSKRIYNTKELRILWNKSFRRTSIQITAYRLRISSIFRRIFTWINNISKRLLFKSTGILRETLFSLFKSISISMVYKRTSERSQLFQREEENTEKSRLLEQQQSRDDFGISPVRLAYPTYTKLQLLQELSGRLLLPTSEFNIGSPRKYTQIPFNTIDGQPKETDYQGDWSEFCRSEGNRDIKECPIGNRFNPERIISIKEVGILDVWDIEVEKDHSYIANGFINHNSSQNPNIQNQPRDKEFRSCYEAAPGHKLVIGDYSAQEPRITAYVTQDEKLLRIFRENKDIYIEMYSEMYNKKITKKSEERKPMKDVFLGMVYGLSKYGFSKKQNITIEEADEILTKSMNTFPKVQTWQNNQRKKKKFVETVDGRKIWINPYSYQADNNKLNSPIQGTAAQMMKKFIAEMHQTWPFSPYPFGFCAPVHDEGVLHVAEEIAEEVKLFTKNTMEMVAEQMCPGVPFLADVCIGNSWADKS